MRTKRYCGDKIIINGKIDHSRGFTDGKITQLILAIKLLHRIFAMNFKEAL